MTGRRQLGAIGRKWLRMTAAVLGVAWCGWASADRASENMDPAFMYEKKGEWAKAAMYYHRAMIGLEEVYSPFHWDGDPAKNAAGKYATEYVQLVIEFRNRYRKCLAEAKLTPERIRHMEAINDLWLSELIDHEGGGQRMTCPMVAEEAERHGDFRLAELMRRGEARYLRSVVMPYHARKARECRQAGDAVQAGLHEARVKACEPGAELAERIAAGHKALMRLPGFGGPQRYIDARLYPQKVNPVAFQYLDRRLWKMKTGEWIGMKPDEVARVLAEQGLKDADENVRLSAVTVLGHMGRKEELVSALGDTSPVVRVAAARVLASTRWASGWAACANHADAAVRGAVSELFDPAGKDLRVGTWVVTGLLEGLNAQEPGTRQFAAKMLERVSGSKQALAAWPAWWKQQGNPRVGLERTGPNLPTGVDETVDFGAWWQVWLFHADNPVAKYEPPATVVWRGFLAVPKTASYRFYVRNCGEGRTGRNTVVTPGRGGFPGLYLSAPAATLMLNGRKVLPHPDDAIQDPNGGMRLDFSDALRLDVGLHPIELIFEYRSKRTTFTGDEPCVRLYWSSEHFLREVVGAGHLVTLEGEGRP